MKILISLFLFLFSSSLHSKEVTLFLVRHGETHWNVEKRVQGQSDIPLNKKGEIQAKATAEYLIEKHPDIKAVYSSDLSRAYFTAKETADPLHLTVQTRPSLREINTGIAEGMKIEDKISFYKKSWEELDIKYPDRQERNRHTSIPGEETIADLTARIRNELVSISQSATDKEKIAIFSHRKALQAFIADITDQADLTSIDIPNCGIVEIAYDSENLTRPFRVIGIHPG